MDIISLLRLIFKIAWILIRVIAIIISAIVIFVFCRAKLEQRRYNTRYNQYRQQHQQQAQQDAFELALKYFNASTWEEAKVAYRKMAMQYHPDRFTTAQAKEDATRRMQVINMHYDVLKRHFLVNA